MSQKFFVSNKDESVRMFRSSFLEMFSKVHYSVPLWLFVPVVLYFIYRSFAIVNVAWWEFLLFVPFGLFIWTLTEYLMHRFIFHYHPTTEWGKRISFIFHGVHHDYPNDSKRLVMVPSVSIPLAFLFYYTFEYLLGSAYVCPFFVGLVSGYLFYDMTHYALHHATFTSKFWIDLKNHHMYHHYREPDNGFGVSTTFWDMVFRTMFAKTKKNTTPTETVQVDA
jgi:sterol desaturase/sphingolipid hydroxylase (fatty acid hydroxylase superfamily)